MSKQVLLGQYAKVGANILSQSSLIIILNKSMKFQCCINNIFRNTFFNKYLQQRVDAANTDTDLQNVYWDAKKNKMF